MVNTWFTSDFHFGHRNIIQYCNRPFASTGEMDAAILANLNRQVGENDQLYFLGDFCIGGPEKARQYRDRIVCRNVHFVEGNHASVITSKPAIHDHFKTGQRNCHSGQDLLYLTSR